MSLSRYSEVETDVRAVVEHELQAFASRLAERGLSFDPPCVEVIVSEPSRYTSELRIYFMRGDNIVDAIEFHIFEKGKQMVHRVEVADWLRQDLEDVIARCKRVGP